MKGDYVMKKVSALLSLIFVLTLFASCSTENKGVDSSASSQIQNASSPTLDESIKEDISDLPAHLYQTTEMRTALSLRYDFEITEPTSLEINVSTISGKLSIGVKNRDTDTYVLELTECTKEKYNQVVSLE
ncbi:MAG: hypothetical protein K0R50_3024, partial [Eubacterium sp.]|nr:hypothetical protein [Eubacterium sp.]